ncbi:MAG: acyl-[acyl-carrier-protein] thioesterase [Eubacteriales bacterium]
MKYTEHYKTKWHDTDAGRKMRPSSVLVYLQETANLQFESAGKRLDAMRDENGLAFILSRISLDFVSPIYAYEDIDVETFTCEGRGFAFNRCFRILRDGEVMAQASSVWALVDLKDGSLVRSDKIDFGFEPEPPLNVNAPARIKLPPAESFEHLGRRKIVYSDIDYNMHMNNTRYPDMLCDFMPLGSTEKIRGMTLSYLHEAPFGEELDVFRADSESGCFFKTVNQAGRICLEAQVICE